MIIRSFPCYAVCLLLINWWNNSYSAPQSNLWAFTQKQFFVLCELQNHSVFSKNIGSMWEVHGA